MPGPRRTIGAGGALGAVLVLLAACGTTNYNSDMGALAGAVEGASKGHFAHVKCAGRDPLRTPAQVQRKDPLQGRIPLLLQGRNGRACPALRNRLTKVIRVSFDGKHWHENTAEDAEVARGEGEPGLRHVSPRRRLRGLSPAARARSYSTTPKSSVYIAPASPPPSEAGSRGTIPMPISRKAELRMLARCPGEAIQDATIAAGVASCRLP